MADVVIRDAREADLPFLAALLGVLFSIEKDFEGDPQVQRRGLKLMKDGCGKHRCVKVAEICGEVVGMATAQLLVSTAEGAMVGLVEDLVVAKVFRGQGIGRLLMHQIEGWAKAHSAKRLQLLADRTNTSALEFYKTIGWRETQLIGLRKKW